MQFMFAVDNIITKWAIFKVTLSLREIEKVCVA